MGNLKISLKLMLICLSFSLPIAVLTHQFVNTFAFTIDFGQWELYGDEYQRPLEKLLKSIPEHDFLVRKFAASKDESLKAKIAAEQGEIDAAFVELEAAQARVGEKLQFTAEGLQKRGRIHQQVGTLKGEWEALKAAAATIDGAGSMEKHNHLIADVRTMIVHSGDCSNLIVDPELDSYYMMDVTLLALPQTQGRIVDIINYVQDVLQRGAITPDERVKVGVYQAMLNEADMARVLASTQTSLTEDANFYGTSASLQSNIPPAMEQYKASTEALVNILTRISTEPELKVTVDEFLGVAMAAHGASFSYWDKCVDEMDAMIRARLAVFEGQKQNALGMSLVALVVSLILAFIITRNITVPLRACVDNLRAQSNLDFTRTLGLGRSDELGDMAGGMDKVTDALKSAIGKILATSESLTEAAMTCASISNELAMKDKDNADLKEMAGSIKDVAKNAGELQELAGRFKV